VLHHRDATDLNRADGATSSSADTAGADVRRASPVYQAARTLIVGYVVLTCVMLTIGLLLTHAFVGTIGHWDGEVNRWFVTRRNGFGNTVSSIASFMVDTFPVIGFALCAVVVLVWRRHRRTALVIVFGLLLEITVFLSVTFLVDRPRPGVPHLGSLPATSSFPSGHTAAAVVLYGGLALAIRSFTERRALRVAAWTVAVVVVLTVGVSRVYRGMHHPSDVIVGAAFGATCLYLAVRAARATGVVDEVRAEARTDAEKVQPLDPIEWDVVA
jgi:membrane-associated phospholipid phosphatase